jgi:hypothetical protein
LFTLTACYDRFVQPKETSTMATLTAIDVLPLVQARAQASTGKSYPGATALYAHAEQAWEDEWITYQALQQQPALRDAANCAWQRRTALSELTRILVRAM